MRSSARCAAATAILTVGLGLTGTGAHIAPFPQFPCPPNTPRDMYCTNAQPLPPPFAPASPAPRGPMQGPDGNRQAG
jgi:hypothetical protein